MAPQRARHRLPAGPLPVLTPLALAALLALPVGAARPEPVVLEDEAALDRAMKGLVDDLQAHETDCLRMAELLVDYRAAVQGEPAAALERRAALYNEYGALIDDANMLCDRQSAHIDAVNLGALTRALSGGKAGAAFGAAALRLPPLQAEHSRLCQLNDKLIAQWEPERAAGDAALKSAVAERAAAPARARRNLGAGALVLGAAAFAWTRRRRPAAVPQLSAPGDYSVGRLLGRGSLGETFEGFDKTLERRVALKCLRPEVLADAADAQRLAAGARAAAGLTHVGLVSLHSLARQDGRAYLVFEFVDGPSLAALLARSGALGFATALQVLESVAEGLEAAHAVGLAHGDVRPADILVPPNGPAKLKGLGFAAVARGTLARVSRLEVPGRFDYMAPEREIGAPDAASDTYALAACFYHMLTGRPPFSGDGALADKRAGTFPSPRTLAPSLPAGMDPFFKTALASAPAARFTSPRALASAAGALR